MSVKNLNEIFLLHRPKEPSKPKFGAAQFGVDPQLSTPHLYLETCLREIWVVHSSDSHSLRTWATDRGLEMFAGAEAFAHTLKIACGLKSAILGETEIFGQFKKAWTSVSKNHPQFHEPLGKWMMALFEDTKAIRTNFLQGKGGSSYGTLLRRLLKLRGDEKILVLGAGQLAEGILPYFEGHPIRVWNRSDSRIESLKQSLLREIGSMSHIEFGAPLDVSWANQIVVCIPGFTSEVLACFEHINSTPDARLIHLGVLAGQIPDGHKLTGVSTLTDLFTLRDEIQEIRELNVKRAELACMEHALDRLPKACERIGTPHIRSKLAR